MALTMASLFDGNYLISEDGALFSTRTNKWLKPTKDKYGYLYYVFSINGKRYTRKAHRMVAQAFLPNPQNKPTVNHINGKRDDNRVCNLEWATVKEQANDPRTKERVRQINEKRDYRAMGAKRNFGRRKTEVWMHGTLVGVYDSLTKAARAIGVSDGKVSEAANGKRKLKKGFEVRYVN